MENQINWGQWATLVIQVATLILVVLAWHFVPKTTERRRKEAEVELWQHAAMGDAHRNIATILYESEQYFNELISKYKCEVNDLTSKMTDEELNKANHFTQQKNVELAMMYMIMPDDKYKAIRDAIIPNQPITLRTQRGNLLIAMRKSQFPDTQFNKPEDIRLFYISKRPDKEDKNQQ